MKIFSSPSRPGISLVIALFMVMAFMIVMSQVMNSMLRTIKVAAGAQGADQARLNAEMGIDLGVYAYYHPDKFTANLTNAKNLYQKTDGTYIMDDQAGTGKISFKINDALQDQVQVCDSTNPTCTSTDKKYAYPIPGNGSVGGSRCNPSIQPKEKNPQWYKDMWYYVKGTEYTGTDIMKDISSDNDQTNNTKFLVQNANTLDHPCLWNKLIPGESVEIPLYKNVVENGKVKPYGPDQLKDFILKIRLPCKSGVACNDENRMSLADPGSNDPLSRSTSQVILWDISSICTKNNKKSICYLSDATESVLSQLVKDNKIKNTSDYRSTITYNDLISNLTSFAPSGKSLEFTKDLYGKDGNTRLAPITDFLGSTGVWLNQVLQNPVLHLSISAPLSTELNNDANKTPKTVAPFAEYQIIYMPKSGTTSPIVTNPSVTATGSSRGYNITLQSSLEKTGGTFGRSFVGQ